MEREMEERLRYILLQVNDWLKYAEVKNGVLLSIDIGVISTLIAIIDNEYLPIISVILALTILFFSTISLLISFCPRLSVPNHRKSSNQNEDALNLIYFTHISRFDSKAYLSKLYSSVGIVDPTMSTIELLFAQQIVINSRIAVLKYRCFYIGFWLSIASFFSLLVGAIYQTVQL